MLAQEAGRAWISGRGQRIRQEERNLPRAEIHADPSEVVPHGVMTGGPTVREDFNPLEVGQEMIPHQPG